MIHFIDHHPRTHTSIPTHNTSPRRTHRKYSTRSCRAGSKLSPPPLFSAATVSARTAKTKTALRAVCWACKTRKSEIHSNQRTRFARGESCQHPTTTATTRTSTSKTRTRTRSVVRRPAAEHGHGRRLRVRQLAVHDEQGGQVGVRGWRDEGGEVHSARDVVHSV